MEPLQAAPVIIEDNAFIGSRCIVVEGVRVEKEAVLGANVVLTANVTNFGSGSADATVRFSEEGVLIADVPVTGLTSGASVVVSTSMNPSYGNRTVTAEIISNDECPAVNNLASLLLNVQQGVCGDGIVNNGEACDGGSSCTSSCTVNSPSTGGGGGGGSGGVFNIELSENSPAATLTIRRNDVVRVQVDMDGRVDSYTFRVRSLYNSVLKLQLIAPNELRTLERGQYVLFDVDGDGVDDIKVEVKDIGVNNAELRFSLLDVSQQSEWVPVRDAPPPRDRTTTTEPVQQEFEPEPEVVDSVLEGVITFVEEFSTRSTVPVWLGSLVSLLIVGLGLGAYFLFRRGS